MFLLKLFLCTLSGIFVATGLCFRVQGIMSRASKINSKKLPIGVFSEIIGIVLLCYLIIIYKTQDLIFGLLSFFISSIVIISWFLLARRSSIR